MSSAPSTTPQPPAGGPPAAPPTKGGGKVFLWILGGCASIVVLGILVFVGLGFFVYHKAKQIGLDPELMQKNPVLAVAKLTVAANPDLETVTSDDSTGTIVVHDKKTGRTSTMRVDPDKQIMVVTDDQGKTVTMKLDRANNRLVMTDDQGKTATISADTKAGSVEIKGPDGNVKLGTGADKAPDWVPAYSGSNPQGGLSMSNATEQTGSFGFVTSDSPDKVLSYYSGALKSAGFKVTSTTSNADGKVGGMVSGQNDGQKRTVAFIVTTENDGTHVAATYNEKKQN
ncbi:MAG TPA: hypothetical protein VI488_06400 [Candidatus Angelobacter sp.]